MLDPGFYNMDCMDGMKEFPDGFFDLAIVDPPYGDATEEQGDEPTWERFGGRFRKYRQNNAGGGYSSDAVERTGGTWAAKYGKKIAAWDVAPKEDYFKELFRVSRHQIIWGGNYFSLPPTRCFIVWRKLTISENFSMAMAEYAWTNFNENAKVFECMPQGTQQEQRFHPTQKPVKLYQWTLARYAKEGYKILDTHCGSASSLIACHRAGMKFWGFEIDPEYYARAKERLDAEMNQMNIFDLMKGAEE